MRREIRIKDAFAFLKKSKIKAGDGLEVGKYPFYTSSSNLSKYLDYYEIEDESLIFGTGGSASIHHSYGKFSTSTDCFVVQNNNKFEIDLRYVYLFLSGNIHILENGFKGAGLKHISKKYLEEVEIPLPTLETQKKIVEVLDKAQELIDRRKEQVYLLDELVVSLYYEEVGCNSNEYERWKEVTIEDIADNKKDSIRSGPFGSDLLHSEFVSKGIYVLGIDNVVTNSFSWGKERYITMEKYETLKRYKVSAGDVLISIMGTTGRSAVVPNDFPIAINSKHLACITPNMNIINPLFLSLTITKNQSVLNQIKSKNKGAIMNGLNLGIIRKLTIKLPPIKTQDEFVERVENIHKKKHSMNESLIELENNYKSILQTMFKAKLN